MKQVEIKPEQLRKGNLMINNGDGSLIIVKAYDIYCLEEGMDSMIMQPIPLSEDWFKDFGFKKQIFLDHRNFTPMEKTVFALGNKLVVDNVDGDYMYCQISDGLFLSGYSRNIKFVHELQNLHFELKRDELTLKA